MSIAVKLTAEERFAATQEKAEQALTESELAQKDKAARTNRLRVLRLAKEAEDKEALKGKTAARPSKK